MKSKKSCNLQFWAIRRQTAINKSLQNAKSTEYEWNISSVLVSYCCGDGEAFILSDFFIPLLPPVQLVDILSIPAMPLRAPCGGWRPWPPVTPTSASCGGCPPTTRRTPASWAASSPGSGSRGRCWAQEATTRWGGGRPGAETRTLSEINYLLRSVVLLSMNI